jgi:hypothetical protein
MLRRTSLESAVVVTLAVTIVAVACAASWSVSLRNVANPVRAAALVMLGALAVAYAAERAGSFAAIGVRIEHGVAAVFLLLVATSIAWSVDPERTLARGGAFGLLLIAAAAIGAGAARDGRAARRVLGAVLAAAVCVALVGLVVYLVSSSDALQPATGQTGARLRGIGQSPNTVAMLFAVALPAAGLFAAEARSSRVRGSSLVAFALLACSIALSGSRGALAAAAAGLLLFGWMAVRRLARRVVVVAAVAALTAGLAGIGELPQPLSAAEAAKTKSPSANTEKYTPNDAQYDVRLEDEVGYSSGPGRGHRGFLSTSGRLDAWRGAIGQGDDRPLLGYGFGTEEDVFVDRYQTFQGGVPENSFIGLFLQLGIVGVAVFAVLVALLSRGAIRGRHSDENLTAACVAVLGAAIVLTLVQSYVYAIGNVATLAVWVVAFLAPARTAT